MSTIRIRVLTIALIPSAALLITGASVAGHLVSAGISTRSFASVAFQVIGPAVQYESAVEQERTISLRALGGDRQALAGLQAQWDATNAAFSNLTKLSETEQGISPQVIGSSNTAANALFAQLPAMRQGVQTRRASAAQVDAFYTQLADFGMTVFRLAALAAPNSSAAVNEITALDLLSVPDLHSRAVGLAAGWAAHGVLSPPDRLEVAQLTGAYRNLLDTLASRLTETEQAKYHQLVAGHAWRLATSGEDDLAQSGRLGMSSADWLTAENTVSAGLLGLWGDSFRQGVTSIQAGANQTLSRSVLLGSLVLALAVAAFITSLLMANGLARRLRRLRTRTLELADVKLPSLVRRIGDGELVDLESEMALLDYGSDEVGEVAKAFNTAQRTAIAAAAAEARTRGGINKVFLDIAHRSQLVVHRQLEVLDVAEAKQSDPAHLELLFQLDHLATRARRNAENLLILGGGQPGRKWRRPAALEDIVRSAVSETEHFARVNTVRLPGAQVQGGAVGDLIHLLAELVDNATVFSPPDAVVTIRGNPVGRGVVVEVEDQGLGIEFAERERLNETLRNPPDFQAMALSGQRHLGLFVVGQLAQRHRIAVSLLESAYGGIKAIVLIPSGIVEAPVDGGDLPVMARPGRHELPRVLPVEAAQEVVPRPRGEEDAGSRGQTADEPAPPSPPWPDAQAPAISPTSWDTAPAPVQRPAERGRSPLPRRARMANLAPGLRQDAVATDSPGPRRPRTPDEARGSMSAFQRGTRLGRNPSGQDN